MKEGVTVTPEQAQYVLQRLVDSGKISPDQVARTLHEMHQEIAALEERLTFLRGLGGRRGMVAARSGAGGKRSRNRTPRSAKATASLQLQGRYLGLLRQIPAGKRASFRRIASTEGREAAIKAMQKALR